MNLYNSMLNSGYPGTPGNSSVPPLNSAPGLLILARQPLVEAEAMFQQSRLSAQFWMECVPNRGFSVNLERYAAVIMAGLTNEELGKISTGICDTPYTALASQAILRNKRIYIPIEQIELYSYAGSSPNSYYDYLHSRIAMLTDSGVAVCTMDELEDCILDEYADGIQKVPVMQQKAPDPDPPVLSPKPREAREAPALPMESGAFLNKRVITERDILEAARCGAARIRISSRTIVTDAAADMASRRRIGLVRG